MTDAFVAIVVSGSLATGYMVSPQIIEDDGTAHPQILVGCAGLTPNPGDYVLVLTVRNNLDNLPIQRFYEATESNGRIVAIITQLAGFVLTGNYKFVGNVDVNGNFSSEGNATISGNVTVAGTLTVAGVLTVGGDAVVSGKSFLTHTHFNNAPAPAPTGPPL